MDEILISFGGEIKALDDSGKVGGYLVEFSDAEARVGAPPDLVREFFTKSTDYDFEDGDKSTVYYDHGLDPTIKKRKLSRGAMKVDDVGVWIETQLELRDAYEKAIFALAKKGKLGWSSGTAPHLVEKKNVGDAVEITRWPLRLDASLTPKPCNPVSQAIPLKSYQPEYTITEVVDAGSDALKRWDSEGDYYRYRLREPSEFDEKSFRTITIKKDKPTIKAVVGKLKGESSTTLQNYMFPKDEWELSEAKAWVKEHKDKKSVEIKGIFEEQLAENTPGVWQLQSAFEMAVRKLATVAASTSITGVTVDVPAKVSEAANEYMQRLIPLVTNQINDFVESGSNENFYLKSKLDELIASSDALVSDAKLEEHSEVVVSAASEFAQKATALETSVKTWLKRVNDKQEFRANDPLKAGRMISDVNRQKLQSVLDALNGIDSIKESITALLEASDKTGKSADPDMVRGLLAAFEYTKFKRTLAARR